MTQWAVTETSADTVTPTQASYLRVILEHQESGLAPARARVAHQLGVTYPTTGRTVQRLCKRDLLWVNDVDGRFGLTQRGRRVAVRAVRRHRLLECFLHTIVAVPWNHIHPGASLLERAVGDTAISHMDDLLNSPTHSPFGCVIPAASDLDWVELDSRPAQHNLLDRSQAADRGRVRIMWISETVQHGTDLLGYLDDQNLRPGATATFERRGERVALGRTARHLRLELPASTARQVFVS